MLRNYFKTAIRNLAKNKAFSFINVFGLAVGLACCMLIAVFVYDELSYDKYPAQADQIYRVGLGTGDANSYPIVDIAVGQGMKDAYPEVRSFTRLMRRGEIFVANGDKQFKEQKMAFADANFLQTFSIPYLEGNAATALMEPNSLVITKAFAIKYFGNAEALGKTLTLNGENIYKVTGVIDKIPDNSHFHFDAFMSMSSLPPRPQTWSNIGYYTYLVLNKNADYKQLEAKFPELIAKYVVPEVQHDMGVTLAEAQNTAKNFKFFLQPLTSIHLHSATKYEIEANGDINYVYIFTVLAVFILLLACVNFTNLSTARSVKRAREVGVRKVMGSQRKQLIIQFLIESVLLTFCALIVALFLVYVLLPYFNEIAGKQITFGVFLHFSGLISITGLCLIVGILAGIYPAFFLSSFKTINVLKGSSLQVKGRKSTMRSSLVVFQFFVSTALIIATIVVYQQLHFMQNKKLGYDKDQVLYLQDTYLLGDNENAFRQQLMQDSRVLKATVSRNVPGSTNMNGTEITTKDVQAEGKRTGTHANIYQVDEDYVPTLGLKVVQGRNFSRAFQSDSTGVIINEALARELGWKDEDAIGKTIVRSGQHEYKVVGVVADFHYASVKETIAPLMMLLGHNAGGMILKIKTDDVNGFLNVVKTEWNSAHAAGPLSFYFLDEKFALLYSSEKRTGDIFTAFAIIAIIIASLGLFGLAAFITEQRTKEIGIRKVLGASMQHVCLLVSKEFLILVAIASVIAIPVTWWAMNLWLEDFAYRITVSGWTFAAGGLLSLIIAMLTMSFRTIKAAIANPVKSLRSEG